MRDLHWRGVAAVVAVAAGLGGLGVARRAETSARARARGEQADLAAANEKLAATQRVLATTLTARTRSTERHGALRASDRSTLATLKQTNTTLQINDAAALFQKANINTLKTCLGGVKHSLQQIAAHDNNEAAQDISTVSGACLSLTGGSNPGLVYPFDFADPDIILVGKTYYGYATNSVGGNIQIIKSTDLTHWHAAGNALPSLPQWATPDGTWAPAVAMIDGRFALYYAAAVAGPGGGEECISVATAAKPGGPFVDTSTAPLECQPNYGGSLDPSPFIDTDGKIYLVWKSNGGRGPATIWSEQLNAAGTKFAKKAVRTPLLVPDQAWESGVVEAPDLVTDNGRYFLFYSGNSWMGADYAIGIATCTGPLGPCNKPSSQPLLAGNSSMAGPGGETVFADTTGAFWLAFHAWLPGAVGYPHSRELYVRKLDLSGPTPVVEPTG